MTFNRLFFVVVALLISVSNRIQAQEAVPPLPWTSTDGRVIQAKFVKLNGKTVIMEKDGKQIQVPFSKLSPESIEQAKKLDAPGSAALPQLTQSKPDQIEYNKVDKDIANLDDSAHAARAGSGLDGLGIAVIRDFSIRGVGCDGKVQGKDKLQHTDSYVIASCSKSMTATLAAVLVTKGVIKWETTLAEAFPELKNKMDSSFATVSLAQLLTHTAGAPERDAFWKSGELAKASASRGNPTAQRLLLLQLVTSKKPLFKPGSKSIYSNAGYYLAASMLEKATSKSWENLMVLHVFNPLGMTTAVPTSDIDTPLTMPAGGISCRMEDLAKFYLFHLAFSEENPLGVSEVNYNTLHTKVKPYNFGMGFIITERPWANGTVYTHLGLCNKFTTVFWLAPNKGFGIIASTPETDKSSEKRLDKAVSKLIEKFK
jgi:CubicO group peptidase (beta-lactamase class C family)